MLITCPRCFATYDVPDQALPPQGKMVRCSGCQFEWREAPMPLDAIAALAPQAEPQAYAPPSYAPPPSPMPATPEKPEKKAAAKTTTAKAADGSKRALAPLLAWTGVALVSLLGLLILFRTQVANLSPAAADVYEAVGLPVSGPSDWFRFEQVKLEKGAADARTVFTVTGQVINQSARPRSVPLLKIYWRATSGRIGPMIVVRAAEESLASGAQTSFSGQLRGLDASSGGEIKITFLSPQEAAVLKPGEIATPVFKPAHEQPTAPPAAPVPVDPHQKAH
jgi:predicted Zn finger-like uncharacterized protein